MKPLPCKAQLTNGSIIIQVFNNFLEKFVRQIGDGSVCRKILSKRPIYFHLAPQASGMFHKDLEVLYMYDSVM